MSLRILRPGAAVMALLCSAPLAYAAPAPDASPPLSEAGMVLFQQEQRARLAPIGAIRGLPGKVLREAGDKGFAVQLEFAARRSDPRVMSHAQAVEFYVLAGRASFGPVTAEAGDMVRIPAGEPYGPFEAAAGTRILAFSNGPATASLAAADARPDASRWAIAHSAKLAWVRSTTGAEAGTPLAIDVKLLWADPNNGAGLFLARMAPGVTVPWESHPVVEEGYLIDGVHDVEECPPSGLLAGRYTTGGYFYRPPNLIHMGPRSVNPTESTWLIRTSGVLADRFYPSCPNPARAPSANGSGR